MKYDDILEKMNEELNGITEKYLYSFIDDANTYAIKEDIHECVSSYLQKYPGLGYHINEIQNRPPFSPDVIIHMDINGIHMKIEIPIK